MPVASAWPTGSRAAGRLAATIYAKAVKRRSKLSGVYLAEFDRALAWAAFFTASESSFRQREGSEAEIEVRGLSELPSDLA